MTPNSFVEDSWLKTPGRKLLAKHSWSRTPDQGHSLVAAARDRNGSQLAAQCLAAFAEAVLLRLSDCMLILILRHDINLTQMINFRILNQSIIKPATLPALHLRAVSTGGP